ncbi:MAG: DUF3413 domain-containing protein, partial [Oceanospirillum sp.]|nr:DUF3413 domain-containing protein [Oceanospirillum sp.]
MSKFWASLSYSWQQGKNFTRGQWLRFVGWLAVIATIALYGVAARYLPFIEVSEFHSITYLLLAYIGHFGFFPFMAWLVIFVPMAILLPRQWLIIPLGFCALFGGLSLLAVDTTVYAQYRFHLSGFVWDMMVGPGAGQIINLSWFTIATIVFVFLGVALVSLWGLSIAAYFSCTDVVRGKGKYVFLVWFISLLSSQFMHIWYEAHYEPEVTGVTRHFPFYYPATAQRDLLKYGLIDPAVIRAENDLKAKKSTSALKYPLNPMECTAPDKPLNVLVIAIDALRADTFNKEVMPLLYERTRSENAQVFMDHHSGGNSTKGGVFSLFFGLPPTYWDGFAAAQSGAEWILQHQKADYDIGVFSSATLIAPAFDRTVFASLQGLRLGSKGPTGVDRDREALRDFNLFLDKKPQDKPFFSFVFLDTVHNYEVPAGYKKFEPQWERVDHVKLNNDFDPLPYFNRYKNSSYFLDSEVDKLLKQLDSRGVLDETLVIITSDHGEEFNDLRKNFWGHGSNFTEYQTKVPLLMLWPGKERQVIDYRTSHYDVAPTVMTEVLGCTNPMSDYSIGHNLFDAEPGRDWLLVHSYFN